MKINLHSLAVKTNSFITSKLLLSLIVISTIAVLFFAGGALTVDAQNEKKIIKLAHSNKPQVKFTEAKVGQQERKFDESFDAEAGWVENLSFKLESISDKPIVYLQVKVNFPETRASGNLMSYGVSFGERPGFKLKNSKPMLLMPGETLEFSLGKEKDKIYKFVNERQPVKSIQKVELDIGFIIFEDKTAWVAGSFLRQDPGNPGRYTPIGNESPR